MNDIKALLQECGIVYKENLPAREYSFYRGGGVLQTAVFPSTREELKTVAEMIQKNGVPFTVLGGCTNVLVRDGGYTGLAVVMRELKGCTVDNNIMTAGAGERLISLGTQALARSLSGLECLHGIPSTLGGAVYMNAGAYGEDVASVVSIVDTLDMKTLEFEKIKREDIGYGYRTSGGTLDNKIIVSAELHLKPKSADDIEAKMCLLRRMRVTSQPQSPSLGCAFKNNAGIGAGYYIDRAGLKGTSIGGAAISDRHANFIINTGGGTAQDYIALMDLAYASVYRKFGVELLPEIKIIGNP